MTRQNDVEPARPGMSPTASAATPQDRLAGALRDEMAEVNALIRARMAS